MKLFAKSKVNFCAFLLLLYFTKETLCLRITRMDVPEKAEVGSTANLSCYFNLDGKDLNSMKWYKDDAEFFRFEPNSVKQKRFRFFVIPGITIDRNTIHNGNVISLKSVTLESSGKYKCEVITEGDFHTSSAEKEMIVSTSNFSSTVQSANNKWIIIFTLLIFITKLQ